MRPILAVDPGLTTGWAEMMPYGTQRPSGRPLASSRGFLGSGQTEGVLEFMRWVRSYLSSGSARGILVVENFVPRGQSALTWQPASLHLIGFLMGEADWYGWDLILQSPAEAKSFATNEKLKRAGWWVPGQDHARDALRHLLRYLCVVERDMDTLRLVAG